MTAANKRSKPATQAPVLSDASAATLQSARFDSGSYTWEGGRRPFRTMDRLALRAALAWMAMAGGAVSAEQVYIRLHDSDAGVPLEFVCRDVPLPGGGALLYRQPTAIYVNGNLIEYERYGVSRDPEPVAAQPDAAMAELLQDVGLAPPPEPAFKSDRAEAVRGGMGPKALVMASARTGVNTIHPGGRRFELAASAPARPLDDGLTAAGERSLILICHPVDINLTGMPADSVNLRVTSGGHIVFSEAVNTRNDTAVRVYLPLSDESGYTIEANAPKLHARFTVALSSDGIRLLPASETREPAVVFAEKMTIGIAGGAHPVARPPASGKPVIENETGKVEPPELYLFNDRNRRAYIEGEPIELSLRARGAAREKPIEVVLTSEAGDPVRPGPVELRSCGATGAEAGFSEFILRTELLRPGRYELCARAGELASNPVPIVIAPVMPESDIVLFSSKKWGDSSMNPADIERLAGFGLNALFHKISNFHISGIVPDAKLFDGRPSADPDRSNELKGANLPPELLYQTMANASGLQAMLSNGVRFFPIHFPPILYFAAGDMWRDHEEDRYQGAAHLGMELRRFPNFAGINYTTGDGATPPTSGRIWASAGVKDFDVLNSQRLKKLRELFEKSYGTIDVTIEDQDKFFEVSDADRKEMDKHGSSAWGFRVGQEIRMTIKGDEDKALMWSKWVNDLYPANFRALRGVLAPMLPCPLVTCGTTWSFGAGGGMYPGAFYRDLDFALNDMQGDHGVCNFTYITGTDIISMGLEKRGGAPWIGFDLLERRTRDNAHKIMLEAMSRNPRGIGVLDREGWICGWANNKIQSEDLANLFEIPRRIGGIFPYLEREDQIAVVSSFRQEVLGGQPFRALWAAHYIATKAGCQAAVVSDAFCEANPAELAGAFKAVLLFHMDKPLSPEFRASLEEFRKSGGLIIADERSTAVDFPDLIRLPFVMPDQQGPDNQNYHLQFEFFFKPLIAKFRESLHSRIEPFFEFRSHREIPNHEINWTGVRSRAGDLQYLTIFNDGKPHFTDQVDNQFWYLGDVATVTIPDSGALYDALRRTRVETVQVAGGMEFECDALNNGGSYYILADRPIDSLRIACDARAERGGIFRVSAEALDARDKPFSGRLPVEFTITDSNGDTRYRLFRATGERINLKIAGNDPAGKWTARAEDQATGLSAEMTFEVGGEPKPCAVTTADSLVFDADAVHDTLRRGVDVTLFPNQMALKDAAEQLVAGLRGKGIEASLRIIWPSCTRNYPMQWAYDTIEDVEVRRGVLSGLLLGTRTQGRNHLGDFRSDNFGNYAFYRQYIGSAPLVYYRDVVLLQAGGLPSNPMLDVIDRFQMLWRNPSPSFPAPGQGLVAHAWGPFHVRHNAVVLHGSDKQGLSRAIDSLMEIAGRQERPPPRFAPRPSVLKPENGAVFKSFGLRAAADDDQPMPASKSSDRSAARSLLPFAYELGIRSVAADSKGRIAVHLWSEDAHYAVVDPNTGTASRYITPPELRPQSADALAEWLDAGRKHWPADNVSRIGEDFISATEYGIGRFRPDAAPVWVFEPEPANSTEAKYARLLKDHAVSGDGARILASFQRTVQDSPNRPILCLLDARNGAVLREIEGHLTDRLALSRDGSRAVALASGAKRGIIVFDAGTGLLEVAVSGPVDGFVVDSDASVAAISYSDARRFVSIVNLTTGKEVKTSHRSADVGLAVSADGSEIAVCYNDGTARVLDRGGRIVAEYSMPAPGMPAFRPDGSLVVAARDGNVYFPASGQVTRTIFFDESAITNIVPVQFDPPGPLVAPQRPPFWGNLPDSAGIEEKGEVFREARIPDENGEYKATVAVPAMKENQVLLLVFDYQLERKGTLDVRFRIGDEPVRYTFARHPGMSRAAVPIRSLDRAELPLIFSSDVPVSLSRGRLLMLTLNGWRNAAETKPGAPDVKSEHLEAEIRQDRNKPHLMIPNVPGQLRDPRREQMSYGMPGADLFKLFDKDPYDGTPLYPAGERSAHIVMEFDKPRVINGIGIWEFPDGPPAESFALEYCDSYGVDEMTRELTADWRLALTWRANEDYYHLHTFEPITARVWRLIILRTTSAAQRLAEIELYEDALDAMFDLAP